MKEGYYHDHDEVFPEEPEADQEAGEEGYCITELLEGLKEEITTLKEKVEEMAEVQKNTLEAISAVELNMEEMTHELRR